MVRQRVSWRLCRGTETSALTAEQIQHLATEFKLPVDAIAQLGVDLVRALTAANGPRSILTTADIKGAKVFKSALEDISKATMLLDRARKQLRLLNICTELAEGRYISQEQHIFALLIKASVNADLAASLFKDRVEAGMPTKLRGSGDQRRDLHSRRTMVSNCLMYFWQSVGRGVSYTTDHGSSERSGDLIDFINAVTACVTDPATALNGETLRREIDRFKALSAFNELERSEGYPGV